MMINHFINSLKNRTSSWPLFMTCGCRHCTEISRLIWDIGANRKNDSTKKIVKVPTDSFELTSPRDCNGTLHPSVSVKHHATLSDEIERKVILLFGQGRYWCYLPLLSMCSSAITSRIIISAKIKQTPVIISANLSMVRTLKNWG